MKSGAILVFVSVMKKLVLSNMDTNDSRMTSSTSDRIADALERIADILEGNNQDRVSASRISNESGKYGGKLKAKPVRKV